MQKWRLILREGFFPAIPVEGLAALLEAVKTDDPELIQGLTTKENSRNEMMAGDLITYCVWKGFGLTTVAEVEEKYTDLCNYIDANMGIHSVRQLSQWYDHQPRDMMRLLLRQEIEHALEHRAAADLPVYAGMGMHMQMI